MTTISLYQVDAFTSRPFAGNPAGVCLLPHSMPDAWMQALAAEMNLSETAFLQEEEGQYRLRWFTPAVEVELCGHATLASAHILYETGRLQAQEQAKFSTLSGRLTARKNGEWIELNFPSDPPEPAEPPGGLLEALGIKQAIFTGKSRFDLMVAVDSPAEVRALQPDFGALRGMPARGILVTARSADTAYDFVSRFFAPAVGVDEDPVTGSAHCCLAPYWASKLGKTSLFAYQASARGGELTMRVEGERVILAGQAVTIFRADLTARAAAEFPER